MRNYVVDPFGPRQSPTICANRPLYRGKGERCRSLDPLAASQCSSGCSLRGSGGREFLRHHASALHIGRSAATAYPGQAHRDHTLSVDSKVPHIVPEFPGCVHFRFTRGLRKEKGFLQALDERRGPQFGSRAVTALING
jgi:hypothetical protein